MAIDNEQNLMAREALLAVLRSEQAYALTGAGVSVWAGYDSWQGVIDRLAGRLAARRLGEVDVQAVVRNHASDPLLCVQRLGQYLGNPEFGDFIRSEFGPNQAQVDDVIYKLVGMPFKHFVTLNFDPSIEQVHAALARPCGSVSAPDRLSLARFMREMDDRTGARRIVHLHGLHSDPDLIVLTEEGYRRLYRESPWFTNFLWLLGVSRRLVFMGFGFADTDLLSGLQAAARDTAEIGPCHFAVVGIHPEEDDGPKRARLRERYLIQPVFYEVLQDGQRPDHRGFVELVNGLSDELGIATFSAEPARPLDAPPGQPDPDDVTRAAQLGDAFLGRIDPGGDDV